MNNKARAIHIYFSKSPDKFKECSVYRMNERTFVMTKEGVIYKLGHIKRGVMVGCINEKIKKDRRDNNWSSDYIRMFIYFGLATKKELSSRLKHEKIEAVKNTESRFKSDLSHVLNGFFDENKSNSIINNICLELKEKVK